MALVDSFGKAVVVRADSDGAWKQFRERWPSVWDALHGSPGEDGKERMSRVTIQIYAEGDKLKFVLSPKAGYQIAFGTTESPAEGLDGLEKAIAAEHFEWKKRKSKNGLA